MKLASHRRDYALTECNKTIITTWPERILKENRNKVKKIRLQFIKMKVHCKSRLQFTARSDCNLSHSEWALQEQ